MAAINTPTTKLGSTKVGVTNPFPAQPVTAKTTAVPAPVVPGQSSARTTGDPTGSNYVAVGGTYGLPITTTAVPAVQAPAAPTYGGADLSQNPAYLTFLQSAGLSEAQARATLAKQSGNLQASLEAQRPIWARTAQEGVEGALNDAAARGVTRGSNRIENQNTAQRNVDEAQASFEAQIANQQSGLQDNYQATVQNNQLNQAQAAQQAQAQAYAAAQEQYKNDLKQYYIDQLNGQ